MIPSRTHNDRQIGLEMNSLAVRVLFTFTLMPLATMARSTNMEENHINAITDVFHLTPEKARLAECAGNTVCAYLQANTRGINIQEMCSCQGGTRCPLVWDSDDGHSITQGSDQYKYCRKAPVLRVCQRGMTAYTTVSLFSKSTGTMLSLNDVNHCQCPEHANYDVVANQFNDIDDDIESMETTYVCSPMRPCGTGEACKVISESSKSFLVNPKCRCPRETSCPTSPSVHHERRFTETMRYGDGALHMIYCH